MSEAAITTRPPTEVRRGRVATTAVFAGHSLLFASWTAHIPLVADRLGLDDAALGTALLGAPIGSVLAMTLTGWLLPRLGSAIMVRATLLGYAASAFTVGLAGDAYALFGCLALWGFFQGALDVSMNTQGVSVERRYGRPIMSGLHAAWSVGGLTGALLGSAAVGLGIGLAPQAIGIGAVLLVINIVGTRSLLDDRNRATDTGEERPRKRVLSPLVLVLGGISLACMLCEGAAADWSAKYLHSSLGATPGFAGLAYAAFSAAMVLVRLVGDRLLARWQIRVVLPLLAGAATAAMTIALLVGHPVAAVVGFAVLGLGLAAVIPSAFTAAGRMSGGNAGGAIATVSALGWVGFVFGPPAIGHLAHWLSLPVALATVPILTAAIALGVRFSRAFR